MSARTRRTLLFLLAMSLCLAPASSAFAKQTLALSSGTFAYTVDAGQTGKGEIVVINDGDEPINVMVYTADVKIDEAGKQSFPLPSRDGGGLLTTPSSWFRVFMPADSKSVGNTPYLELEPGERVPVTFDFTPPTNVAPGDHNTMIFFEMFDFSPSSEGAAAQVSSRIGARVALRVNGQVIEKVLVRPFEVPQFRVGTLVPYNFTVVNGGNLNKPISASVTVLDRSDKEVVSSEVASDTTVYANSNLRLVGEIDTVAGRLGPHTVEVKVTYTKEGEALPTEIVEQRTIWLIPLWLLIVVAALVFIGAVALAVRVAPGRRAGDRARFGRSSAGADRRQARAERARTGEHATATEGSDADAD